MAYDVDRRPGAWVAAQAAKRQDLIWLGLAVFFLITGVFLALALGHHLGIGASFGFLALVLAVRPYANRQVDEALNWLRGARAEEAVGATLDELRRDGWFLLHDVVQKGEGNIDHIAAGPNGVFMIETKLRRYEDPQLWKARRQAAKLHDELGVWVTPVICLHERRGKPFQADKVSIVPRQHLVDWLRAQSGPADPVRAPRPIRRTDRLLDEKDCLGCCLG